VIPILATILVGVATKVGVGLAATAAKKIFTKSPADAEKAAPASFADELQRAKPATNTATPLAAVDAPVTPATASMISTRARGADAAGRIGGRRATLAAAAAASDAAAPASTNRLRDGLPISARVPTRRRGRAHAQRLRQHHVGAYRRMDVR
jgi:hypothetical protein